MEMLSTLAGKSAPSKLLVDVTQLKRAYFDTTPDVEDPNQLVHFGTSRHCGSSLRPSFNESQIVSEAQEIVSDALASAAGNPDLG